MKSKNPQMQIYTLYSTITSFSGGVGGVSTEIMTLASVILCLKAPIVCYCMELGALADIATACFSQIPRKASNVNIIHIEINIHEFKTMKLLPTRMPFR